MKLIFLNLAADRDWGGGENWTLYTAEGLAERGHSVRIIGRKGSRMVRRAESKGLKTSSTPVGIDYSPVTIFSLFKLFQNEHPDVLIVHHNKDLRTGGAAARLLGAVHPGSRIAVVHRNGFPILRDRLNHCLSYKFTDRILTNSEAIMNRYIKYSWIDSSSIDVIPNGIRTMPGETNSVERRAEIKRIRIEWGVNPEALVAVYVGRLTSVKRVSDLLEVFRGLDKRSRWHLVIMGSGSEETRLSRLADSAGLNSRVHFTGFQTDASYQVIASDLVVLPSEQEGMPNALMEAMSHGIPVAATPVGDVPLLLNEGKSGWLIPVGNVDTWIQLLNRLEDTPETLGEKGRVGRDWIRERFSFDRMLDGIETCFRKAVTAGS